MRGKSISNDFGIFVQAALGVGVFLEALSRFLGVWEVPSYILSVVQRDQFYWPGVVSWDGGCSCHERNGLAKRR